MSKITPTSLKRATQLQTIIDRLVQPAQLKKEPLVASEIKFLIESVKKQLQKAPKAVIDVTGPLIVCGDTHGQYRDVLRMLDMMGFPPRRSYLFLGKRISYYFG